MEPVDHGFEHKQQHYWGSAKVLIRDIRVKEPDTDRLSLEERNVQRLNDIMNEAVLMVTDIVE